MSDQVRPRLVVVEGEKKSEKSVPTRMSLDSFLNFAQDVARIENVTNLGSEKISDKDGFVKVKTADIVSLVVARSPEDQDQKQRMATQSADKK